MHIYFPVLTNMYHFFLFCLWYEVFIDFFSTWLFTLWFSEDNCNDKSCAFEQLVLNAVTVHGEFALELCLLSYSMLSPSIWLGSFFSFLWAGKLLTILHYNFLRAQEMKPVHSFSNKKINGKKIPFLFKNVGLMSVNTCVQIYIHFFFLTWAYPIFWRSWLQTFHLFVIEEVAQQSCLPIWLGGEQIVTGRGFCLIPS